MSAQAAAKKPEAGAAAAAAVKVEAGSAKKKSKLPLIIIAAVVVLGGGAGAYFAFKPKPAAAAAGGQPAAAEKPEKAEKPGAKKSVPVYYKFDPAFVVNFGGEGSARYLQVTVEAMSRDPKVLEELKNDEPAVRNDLVMLFSGQDNATLMSNEGKEKLRASTLEVVRKVLNSEGANGKEVEAVYFTSFVIQ
jgi:flagellar FliL protein